ncbi:hypothetical protein BD779DRAFT_1671995 [Infundibulicybe gibba]|nr:hypothetical protein BD779DRAFT_1671995 [Infundibulicybe gibba]
MAALTLAEAEMIGILLHSALYGIFLVLFVGSLYIPLSRPRRQSTPPNRFLISVTIVLFVLITVHWVLQLLRLIDAFIYHANDDEGPSKYYADGAQRKNVVKTAFYVAQTFTGDCTMAYRLYIVWGRNWKIVVLPALLSTGLLVAGSGATYSFAHLTPGENIFVSSAGHWVLTVFATTLCTNVTVTSLIAYRVWSIHRPMKGVAQQSSMPVIQVILESAAIYTVCLIPTLAGYLGKENYQFITLDATSPAIGIAFALIIVRVGLGMSTEKTTQMVNGRTFRSPITSASGSEPLHGVTIKITKSSDVHGFPQHFGDEMASKDYKRGESL